MPGTIFCPLPHCSQSEGLVLSSEGRFAVVGRLRGIRSYWEPSLSRNVAGDNEYTIADQFGDTMPVRQEQRRGSVRDGVRSAQPTVPTLVRLKLLRYDTLLRRARFGTQFRRDPDRSRRGRHGPMGCSIPDLPPLIPTLQFAVLSVAIAPLWPVFQDEVGR
jgi:hypothetical protein